MDRKNICLFKQLALRNQSGACGGSLFWCKVLAPGYDFHSKRPSDPSNFAPDIPKAEHAERLASNSVPNGPLPAAGPNGSGFGGEVSSARENESPGQLYRRTGVVVGMHDFDTACRRHFDIN